MRSIKISLQLIIISMTIFSCLEKKYEGQALQLDPQFRQLLNTIEGMDTFYFQSSGNKIDTFVISSIDSILHNKEGTFINARPIKTIAITYRQIPDNFWQKSWIENAGTRSEKKIIKDATLISVTKFLDSGSTEVYISFKNFRKRIKGNVMPSDSCYINDKKDYYCWETDEPDMCQDSTDIKTIYISKRGGIKGYTEKSGLFRKRIN